MVVRSRLCAADGSLEQRWQFQQRNAREGCIGDDEVVKQLTHNLILIELQRRFLSFGIARSQLARDAFISIVATMQRSVDLRSALTCGGS
jgi:hypothetical protein